LAHRPSHTEQELGLLHGAGNTHAADLPVCDDLQLDDEESVGGPGVGIPATEDVGTLSANCGTDLVAVDAPGALP
jgi:hypothetical protein